MPSIFIEMHYEYMTTWKRFIERSYMRNGNCIRSYKLALEIKTGPHETIPTSTTDVERPKEELLPCWILEMLPNDILLRIIKYVVLSSGESWVNLSLTCSTFNKLCFHSTTPFQTFSDFIYSKQVYDKQTVEFKTKDDLKLIERDLWGGDDREMIKNRPFVKFQGIYISVVNYMRYGANAEGSSSLLSPVQMITYYRYFRFYEDGRCLRLLTTDEPSKVVSHFSIETKPRGSAICFWKLEFDYNFGQLIVTRNTDKYDFIEELQIRNQGRKVHHRLKWLRSSAIAEDGSVSECSLRNEKPFFFSRVKSYI